MTESSSVVVRDPGSAGSLDRAWGSRVVASRMRSVATVALVVAVVTALAAPSDARPPLRKPRHGFQTRVGEYTIEPNQDLEVCEYRRLSNAKAMDISRFQLRMPLGGHHFAVWRYGGKNQDDSQFPDHPFRSAGCVGASRDDVIPQLLIPTQTPNAIFDFPKGVALHLEAHQQVWLNPHMRNFGTRAMEPDIRFNLVAAKKNTVKHHAEGLAIGNSTDIHIPAGGDQTLTVEWPAPADFTAIHLSTHQHRLGTHATIDLVSADGASSEPLVDTLDWEHPQSAKLGSGRLITKGQKLRITCTWHNTDDHEVRFGPLTTDEMCFIIGFYYRADESIPLAVGEGCLPSDSGLLCPLAHAVPN